MHNADYGLKRRRTEIISTFFFKNFSIDGKLLRHVDLGLGLRLLLLD